MRARRPLLALVGLALAGCALKSPPSREEAVHIIRKIILRVGSYLNYLILKLH